MGNTKAEITIWYRKTKGGWEHNHIEDGWIFGSTPTPKEGDQAKAWKNAKWKRNWGYLVNGEVHEIVKSKED